MKPAPFEYFAPTQLDHALETLAEHGWDAKILAGGQSLIPSMNFRLIQPAVLLDLNRVDALSGIERTPSGGLRIGAMTRQSAVERYAGMANISPMLAEAMPQIAHPQIRNRGTIGGSIAHADPAAELPVLALALDATLHIRSVNGERWSSAKDFFVGMFETTLEPEEMLVGVEFPAWPERTGSAFVEVARRKGDYAIVGVAARLTLAADGTCESAKLVYLNVGDRPMDAVEAAGMLVGGLVSAESIKAAADHAAQHEIDPIGNVHSTAPYQRHLATVLTKRALTTALARVESAS